MYKKGLFVLVVCMFVFTGQAVPGDNNICDLADDISKKAAAAFQKDKAQGLKLFIKAEKICDALRMKYNLGIAYYKFGDMNQAEIFLKMAVENSRNNNAVWLNNLASVMLENNSDPGQAVNIARKATKADPELVYAKDTLARAEFQAGNPIVALKIITRAALAHKKIQELKDTKEFLFQQYITLCLNRIKNNQVDQGLADLKKADFNDNAAATYCKVLTRLGKNDQALTAIDGYQKKYPGNSEISSLKAQAVSKKIEQFYIAFKSGRDALAVQEAKVFSENNPDSAAARKACDELFNALIADTKSIELPEVARTASNNRIQNQNSGIDDMINSIGAWNTENKVNMSLTVDVDTNIPKGKKDNPHGIALLIGNQDYQKGLSSVKYAKRDVVVMKKYIEKTLGFRPENIITRYNVTSGDFRTLFGSNTQSRGKLHTYIKKGKSDVFIYYVGHGCPGPKGNTAYLVPIDAEADFIQNTGYSLNTFYSMVEHLPARNMTIVLDACFSGDFAAGQLFKNISPAMVKTTSPVKDIAKAAIFCAADKDQVATWYPAKRHSLFSYYFLKGLQGAADTNNDRIIRLDEMKAYLLEEVKYRARRESNRTQTPLVSGDGNTILVTLK